ncbi:MAG: transcriptional regulator, HxlR family [Candidatus Adlerbacteria bacterium]|nr:transcriptional regulator, HxlR family [Candidatus Adlerbacteria bacterium]
MARTADLVGDTCSLIIVRDLLESPRRFSELTASLAGVSTRTLTLKLKNLLAQGLIERTEYSEKPPRVEYALTAKGKALKPLVAAMRIYGEKYL